ncbi:MAG TPA: hypothetical protein VFV47_13995 [Hyphomicrobiaceae bacterium]|nr:hypothetical protein [Hyphomicrobiaceae bacterium]
MTSDDLEKLRQIPIPPPREDAKARALSMALEAFDADRKNGSVQPAARAGRPAGTFRRLAPYALAASLAVTALGVARVMLTNGSNDEAALLGQRREVSGVADSARKQSIAENPGEAPPNGAPANGRIASAPEASPKPPAAAAPATAPEATARSPAVTADEKRARSFADKAERDAPARRQAGQLVPAWSECGATLRPDAPATPPFPRCLARLAEYPLPGGASFLALVEDVSQSGLTSDRRFLLRVELNTSAVAAAKPMPEAHARLVARDGPITLSNVPQSSAGTGRSYAFLITPEVLAHLDDAQAIEIAAADAMPSGPVRLPVQGLRALLDRRN